jgi:soluble lytic murein transglycosylase-like protein
VSANNKSTSFSNALVTCQIWKESSFDPAAVNGNHKGLMQISPDAVDDVNHNTPEGVHFEHSQMTDAAKNIQCGTYYLQILFGRHHTVKSALEHFGTGAGYADNILTCETCSQGSPSNVDPCLNAIHP